MRISIFKIPKPKQFEYNPLYQGSKNKEAEERLKNIDIKRRTINFMGTREVSNTKMRSNTQLVLILAFLLILVYFLLN